MPNFVLRICLTNLSDKSILSLNNNTIFMKVKTREFLRNFKTLTNKLEKGELSEILIEKKNGGHFRVVVQAQTTPFEHSLQMIKEFGPFQIVRPEEDLF